MGEFKFRNLILGKKVVASRPEFKRIMLTGYLSLICIVVSVIYAALDFFNDVYYAFPAYIILFVMPFIAVTLIRWRFFKAAKVILMVSTNLVVFWSALHDPFETGAFMFFLPVGIGSFVILDIEDRPTGLALACLTTILFMLAYFGDLRPENVIRPSDNYIRLSFVINYFISITICILAVSFLMNLNKHSESELIRKQNFVNEKNKELQKVNEELDRFVYSVSHDLRSPLSSILGLTNLAKLAQDTRELNQILTMIEGRVNTQDHFIREIIDYARNARTEIGNEPVKVAKLVDDITEALKYNENAHRIDFRKQIPADAVVISDRIRLTIVLSNLISNAIKYHDFTKEKPFIEIGYHHEPLAISIRDNGTGIQSEHQEKIFNMFYRGSDRPGGSGLGLFITKETVTKLGGTIELKSTYGQGSTFIVYLPKRN